jgi:tetratricopeptide (TPR) repeat protein
VAIAWRQGTEFPEGLVPEYSIVAAFIYRFLGSNPLNVVLWNALFGALAVVAGYRIAARLAGRAAARPAAILIALWPSAVLWSTQLLKDTVSLWLILLVLYLTMCAMDPPDVTRSGWRAIARWAGLCVALFTVALILHRFRYYVLQVLIPVSAVFIIYAFVHRTRRTPWRVAATCTVVAVLVLAVWASRRVDLDRLFAPRYPEIGYVNLAVVHQSRGDLGRARQHYERALVLARDYPPALAGLGAIALAVGERSKAVGYFERALVREPGDGRVRAALEALRRPAPVVARPKETQVRPLETARSSPAPTGARRQASDAGRRAAPGARVIRETPAESLRPDAKPLLALIPAPIPTPPRLFAISGPRSDYVTGGRAWQYGDALGGLSRMRRGFTSAGGHSLIDGDVEFHGYWDVLGYLPRAVANVFLVPYPWQWFDIGGSTGRFRALSVVETVLLYTLIVPLTVGLWACIRRGSPDALYLALFVLAQAVLLGLIVNNMGTLFRLRLQLLLPLFVATGLGWAWLLDRRRLTAATVSDTGGNGARRPSE